MLDVVFTLAIITIVAGAAVPATITAIERPRTLGAARYLASRMAFAHAQAVLRTANTGVRLRRLTGDVEVAAFTDGNRNGLRLAEIDAGADPALSPPARFSSLFPRVTIELDAPVILMSFTAEGTSTSGTVYLRGADGTRYGVRVLGASGRTRVLRFIPSSGLWIELL